MAAGRSFSANAPKLDADRAGGGRRPSGLVGEVLPGGAMIGWSPASGWNILKMRAFSAGGCFVACASSKGICMSRLEVAIGQLKRVRRYTMRLLEHTDPEEWFTQP